MRERITLVHSPDLGIDPEALSLSPTSLKTPALESVREDRLTLALDGLPTEVASLLQDFEQLHIRWTSPEAYGTLEPFASRLSPGLHVWYTPTKGFNLEPYKLCGLLRMFGATGCTLSGAFTKTEDKHPSGESTHYFYQTINDLQELTKSLQSDFCGDDSTCQTRVNELNSAASVDFTFDSATEVSKVTAFWGLQSQSLDLKTHGVRRTEIGVLAKGSPPNMGEHDVGMGGILTVLGESKTPSPTLFTFPSRHRTSDGNFASKFLLPTGLHPTLQLSLSNTQPPNDNGECLPYTYLTLPKTIFADRYQLDDDLFMASKNLTASRYASLPVDLEAPAYTTPTWGSNVLLELAQPAPSNTEPWTAEIPLHMRYLEPSSTGEREISVPYPVLFWACPSDSEVDFGNNPFDRSKLGYDALFPSNTVFWHVEPKPVGGSRLLNTVNVPVLKQGNEDLIRQGTFAVLGVGALWVLFVIARTFRMTRETVREGLESKKRQ